MTASLSIAGSFGTDFGLSNVSGLEESGDFIVRMFSNATGRNYAYADSGPTNNECALFVCAWGYFIVLLILRSIHLHRNVPNTHTLIHNMNGSLLTHRFFVLFVLLFIP